jgi:hypothetical protein
MLILFAERVQNHAIEEIEEVENQRGRIRNVFFKIKEVLE